MEVSTKELRIQPGKIVEQAANGQEVVVTFRGKAMARIVPFQNNNDTDEEDKEVSLFGLWKNNETESVENYVRRMRKGRQF